MEPIKIPMVLKKSTKGTHVYEANYENAAITTVYIRKAAFTDKPPTDITLTVTD